MSESLNGFLHKAKPKNTAIPIYSSTEKLGPDLVFIVMSMTNTCLLKCLNQRCRGDSLGRELVSMLNAFSKVYEPAGEKEMKAFNLVIEEEMTLKDVLFKVE